MQEAPTHQSHVYGWIRISQTIFEKGHQRNIPVKLFQNLTSGFGDFLRVSSCPYSARSPHSPEPCLWTDQNFANNFWNGSPKEHSCEIILNQTSCFWEEDFLRITEKIQFHCHGNQSFWWNQILWTIFWRGPPEELSCQVWSKLAQRFGRRRCLKKLFRTHDRHLTTLKAPLEHVVLRWAKKLVTSKCKCFQFGSV